jgi:hypothetical protein
MSGSQLPSLSKVATMFTSRFKTPEGMHVMGQMLPPRSGAAGGMEDPRRPFRTGPKSTLRAGTVIIGADATRYILLDNGVAERDKVDYRTYKVLPLAKSAVLNRVTKTLDPNTKRMVEAPLSMGTIWYDIEPTRAMEDTFRIPSNQYTMITDFAVQMGEQLGDLLITRVEQRLGVYQFQGHVNGAA